MRKFLLISMVFLFVGCPVKHVETVVPAKGVTIKVNDAQFVIDEGTVPESTKIRIETFASKGVFKKDYDNGFVFTGRTITIKPESRFFEKPVLFSQPAKNTHLILAAKIGKGFVPLAGSKVEGETLQAKIQHGGEYYIIEAPEKYGILDHSKADSALLIVSDLYVSDHLKNFRNVLKEKGYNYPVWTFIYPGENSIEENAKFLAEELEKLHAQYGKFRLDVVGFGIGGVITHRYLADSALYQRDISPAVIAIGTPFFGSGFTDVYRIMKALSPYRFFYVDAMGENSRDLAAGSELIAWIRNHRSIRGGWLKNEPAEDKNFASIRGKTLFPGELPEEKDGDGLVVLGSTMLTAIEPEPFDLDHFDLFENGSVQKVVCDFIQLYRGFAMMDLFLKVWQNKIPFSKISELWEREAKLNFRNLINFDILVEYNQNMLKSAPKDAILITNGDNDTYPAWFLQEKGFRTDVIVLNRNLFNVIDNVKFLKNRGLPLEITEEKLNKIQHIYEKETRKLVTISDQLIELLIRQNKRPVVFSTTVYDPQQYGHPLKLCGLVYEIGKGDVNINVGEGDISVDIERTKKMLHSEFTLEKLFSTPLDSLSIDIRNLAQNYAATAFSLSLALGIKEEYEESIKEIEFAKYFSHSPIFFFNEAMTYFKMGMKDKTDSILKDLRDRTKIDLEMQKEIADVYYETGMHEKTIEILAECLKENPEDTTITNLIKKYQEKK